MCQATRTGHTCSPLGSAGLLIGLTLLCSAAKAMQTGQLTAGHADCAGRSMQGEQETGQDPCCHTMCCDGEGCGGSEAASQRGNVVWEVCPPATTQAMELAH